MRLHRATVLSIDPTYRGLAYAVLDGPERLVEWKVMHFSCPAKRVYVEKVRNLLERFRPDVLVMENTADPSCRKRARARTILHRLEALAREEGIPIRRVSRLEVRQVFENQGKPTKHNIALALSRFFPILEESLPRKHRLWETEDLRMNGFDAISFAVTLFRSPGALREIL